MSRRTQLMVTATPLPLTNEGFTTKVKPLRLVDHCRHALLNGLYETVRPYLNPVNNKDAVTGRPAFDRAAVAMAAKAYGEEHEIAAMRDANWSQLARAMAFAERSIRDTEGNSIDRKSRRQRAITDTRKRIEAGAAE